MHTHYTRRELVDLDTIEQAWDGDELKIEESVGKVITYRVWLTLPENREWNGDYTVERLIDGVWESESYYFNR